MKNRLIKSKGVTLIALVITIIVLLILASIATYSGIGVINSSKLTAFTTEMKIMQTQVNNLYEQWKSGEVDKDTIGLDLTSSTDVQKQAETVLIDELGYANNISELTGYRFFNQETIKKLGIDAIEQEFFINIEERQVVSYLGLQYEGDMYYTLNQLPQGLYNVDYDPQQGLEPTFDLSYEKIGENKWRITVSNIKYDGYIDKWYVKYQEDGADYWNTTEDMSFIVNKSWIYNVTIENENTKSKLKQIFINDVNEPELSEGMIPIKWDDSQSKWVICSENDPEWYKYIDQASGVDGTSKWANVMLSDGKYYAQNSIGIDTTNKQVATVGQLVEEADLGSMFVWIPRFAYSIESGYHTNQAGKINISFLKETDEYKTGDYTCYTSQGTIGRVQLKNASGEGNWNEHPAFNYGGTIIPGIWIAKFEASSTTDTPDTNYGGGNTTDLNVKVLPGKQSWRQIGVGNCYTNCVNMNNSENASYYGISQDDNKIDPHLMKDSEWGVAAYFTQSSYGRNQNEVTPNAYGYGDNKYIYTGYAGDGTSSGNEETLENKPTNVYYYNTDRGMLASTTGNETGIYDLSGGAWERIAAYINNGNKYLEGIGKSLLDAPAKHKDVYEVNDVDESTNNFNNMSKIIGNAIWEVSASYEINERVSWHGDVRYCPAESAPFFPRGGSYWSYELSGVFALSTTYGGEGVNASFRPTIVVY